MVALNDVERELVERIRYRYRTAEAEHTQFRKKADEFYALYRGLQDFRLENKVERDRDLVVRRAQKEWGAELFIPIAFRTVETVVPRMLAHRPRMNPLPEDDVALGNVNNMRLLIDKQQRQIKYERELQKVCKDGLIMGLGVQKVGWRKEYRKVKGIKPSQYKDKWVELEEDEQQRCVFDDPYAEWVDPFAFLWDPFAHNVESADYLFHRVYRSPDYVAKMVARGIWRSQENDPTCEWTLEDLLSSGPSTQEQDIWSQRRAVEGYSTSNSPQQTRHEVWEHHADDQVYVLLNSEFPVMTDDALLPDASHPFMAFRPTIVGGRMVGIGEIEPIRDLQYELNTIRGQRVDAVTMALNRGYFFDEGVVNADDLQIGPNIGVPVNGSPRDALFPMQIGDVPTSAYQETAAITSDAESVVGISDPVTGGESPQQTATGAQLVVQAAGIRIQNKARLMGQEVIIPAGEAWVKLNQAKILTPRTVYEQQSEGVWSQIQLGPAELQGLMSIEMDDGSTMAENVPQMRQDMQSWQSLVGNPLFNQEWVARKIVEAMGVKNTEGWVVPPEPQVPASQVEGFLQQLGVPPEAFTQYLDAVEAQQQDQQQGQGEQPQLKAA